MSYGFEVLNSNGKVIANSQDFNYGLVTQGSVSIAADINGTTINWTDTGEIPLLFIRPVGFWQNFIAIKNLGVNGASFVAFTDLIDSTTRRTVTTQNIEYRVYKTFKSLGNIDNYGIQLFDASGFKTFDSNYKLPLIKGVVSVGLPLATDGQGSPVASVLVPAAVGGLPWINASSIANSGIAGFHYYNSSTQVAFMYPCFRYLSGYLDLSYGHQLAGGPGNTVVYGAGVQKIFHFLGADPVALNAYMQFFSGSNTCSFTAPATNCTTNLTYAVYYTGGNGSGITYNWSILNNTGGFVFTSGTTNNTASISKTGGTGTYTCTLQCIVSQTGSTPVTVTTAVSATHSASPITGSIDYSSGSNTCNYTSGSCTTSETFVMTTSGGDGTTKTYSWSLINNTGSLSINGSTTGSTVVVDKTATAGTYTATLQCIVSQSGLNYTFTTNLSRTHSQQSSGNVINPLGFNGTTRTTSDDDSSFNNLSFLSNGTWSIDNTIGNVTTGNWWSAAPSAGIGNSYWVNIIRGTTSGTGSSTATTGWQQLTTTRTVGVSTTAPTANRTITATYTSQIAASSAGTVLSSSTLTLSATARFTGGGL